MNRVHLYILAGLLTIVGLTVFIYKVYVLSFPLTPKAKTQVWNVEARVSFLAEGKPVKVSMFIPTSTRRFAIVDEHFISGGFGMVAQMEQDNRVATWSIRKADGRQSLYYQAVIRALHAKAPQTSAEKPEITSPPFQGPKLEAAKALMEDIKAKSADLRSMVAELVKRLNQPQPSDEITMLLGPKPGLEKKIEIAVRLLEQVGLPARKVQGLKLQEETGEFSKKAQLLHWLEVYDGKQWLSFDPLRGKTPVPDNWFRWWHGPKNLVHLEGGTKLNVTLSVSPKLEEGITAAFLRGEISKPLLLRFSLFSLPVNTQAVFRIMLLVPIGALVLVILRNLVGIKTFGTFMPVLIGLAFRETGLLWGIFLFTVVVVIGLGVRFYLEQLKLLVVPRLAAVLIVVILSMAGLSIMTHALGIHRGLSIALFPIVILTMTIERMSIVWEERGSNEALISGVGSLITAAIAFVVMNIKLIEHLVFVFPELLLVLLAIILLLGRYTGYRLTDLMRFKELARG